ncbi:MAG TPA: hypothetical protein VH684_15070 [Xanthobacteraceae bacterium]|jgi:hypothetical protein
MTSRIGPARSDQQFARVLDKQISPLPTAPTLRSDRSWPAEQPSRRRRAIRALIMFFLGATATLAWQSYGEAAREMIASSYPQLGWLAPQTAAAETVPETTSQAAPAAASESEDLKSISDSLAAVRESIDQLAAQIAANQQTMANDIAELKAAERNIFDKVNSAPPPRPAAPPARKPVAAAAPPAQPPAR